MKTLRGKALWTFVADLVDETWGSDEAELANALMEDESFPGLCKALNVGGPSEINELWDKTVESLSDRDLDQIECVAPNPATYLAHRVLRVRERLE